MLFVIPLPINGIRSSSTNSSILASLFFKKSVKVGAYYYPWYYADSNFHGGKYIRTNVSPSQLPTLGAYDDTNYNTISQHIQWSHQANINVWVISWWGEGSSTDTTFLNYMLPHDDFDLEFAIHYETTGLTSGFTDFDNAYNDITYLVANYFNHDSYLRIDGKPVIFIYEAGTAFFAGMLDTLISNMRQAALDVGGYDIYIVADAAYGDPVQEGLTTYDDLKAGISLVDALTTYDTYGAIGVTTGYAGQSAVNAFFKTQSRWKSMGNKLNKGFIPTVAPGFNDMAVRDGHYPLSRKLTLSSEFGTLFKAMLKQAVRMVDNKADRILMVTSFNEWHEDTQIEPVAEQKYISVDNYYGTELEYEAYGEKYLNILNSYA